MDRFDRMVEQHFQHFGKPGQVLVLNHLQSETGKAMNGRRVVTVGLDPPQASNRRIRVKLLDSNTQKPTGKILQIKPQNLLDRKNYCPVPSQSKISQGDAMKFLKTACQNTEVDNNPSPDDARDPYKRVALIQPYISENSATSTTFPENIKCMDLLVPEENMNAFEKVKLAVTPACVGDGRVDFTRFGEGILGGSEDECAICTECMTTDLIRLPCNHRFHVACVKPWLQEHQTCPTCREKLINPWETYLFARSSDQIQKRFDEWFVSGMCERCQAVNLENNPFVNVTLPNGEKLAMPLSVAQQNGLGLTDYERLQGQIKEKVNMVWES